MFFTHSAVMYLHGGCPHVLFNRPDYILQYLGDINQSEGMAQSQDGCVIKEGDQLKVLRVTVSILK